MYENGLHHHNKDMIPTNIKHFTSLTAIRSKRFH